jgi:hypothetical protein
VVFNGITVETCNLACTLKRWDVATYCAHSPSLSIILEILAFNSIPLSSHLRWGFSPRIWFQTHGAHRVSCRPRLRYHICTCGISVSASLSSYFELKWLLPRFSEYLPAKVTRISDGNACGRSSLSSAPLGTRWICYFHIPGGRHHKIRGVTRNVTSAKSQALTAQGVEMIQAD